MAIVQEEAVSETGQRAARIHGPDGGWSAPRKVVFRITFLFFVILIVPLKWEWYVKLFEARTLFDFFSAQTGSRLELIKIPGESGRWGLASYANWAVALGIALAGGLLWSLLARNSRRKSYNDLYYWLRVAVRYRIAIGIIAFAYIKLFPMQMPFPSLGNLHTNFGDFTAYKLYWQSVGVSIGYEVFLGAVELLAAVLLFFRSTAALGAVLNAGVLYNVAHANHAYDGGVHVGSAYIVLLSLFVLAYDLPAVWKLLVKREDTIPSDYRPVYSGWLRKGLGAFKAAFVFGWIFVYGYLRYDMHYNQGRLKEPVTPGLPQAAGYYDVTEFRLNNKVVPYTPDDSVRWHDVILENYATFIYKVNRPAKIALANGTPRPTDLERSYELAGVAGGRRFLSYEIDSTQRVLRLKDKSLVPGREDEPSGKKQPAEAIPELVWRYERPTSDRLIIWGLNEYNDSIHVVLDRRPVAYTLKVRRSELQ